jgi:predicted AlkP superfamily pyrophosphatase or phosphodiesterase
MKVVVTVVLLLSAAACAQAKRAPAREPVAPPPRLVVLCAVDQLATWVHRQAEPHFAADGGFARLRREGVTFAQCAFEHACTETGPGHATIGTGAPASVHGIVRNAWWDRERGKMVYCVDDEVEPLDALPEGKLRGPGRLLVPTFAQSLKAHVAHSRVASVAWKDRSAILMVGRGADAVAWMEKATGRLVTNRAWAEDVPPWIALFNEARAIDTFFGAVWDRVGPDAAYSGLVDDRPFEYVHPNGSLQRTLPQPITGGKVEPDTAFYEQVYSSPFGNTLVRLAAEAAVRGLALGQDDVPDLLCVSFSSTDLIGHQFGPDSVEARDGLLRLDRELAQWFTFLDEAVGAGRWSLFLTADHGVAPQPEAARARGIAAGRGPIDAWVKSAVERTLAEAYGPPPSGHGYTTHIGESAVFFDEVALQAIGPAVPRLEVARRAAAAASRVRGVAQAVATDDVVSEPTLDPVRLALRAAIAPERAGDVQFVLAPNWLNGALPGSHGSPHPYDREVVGFGLGVGWPRGVTIGEPITPGFGAVYFAHLLGVPKPSGATERVPATLLERR